MAIRIRGEQIDIRTQRIAAPGAVTPPAELAAGAGTVGGQRLGQDIARLGRDLGQAFAASKNRKDSADVASLETEFRIGMQNILFDDGIDKEGNVKGILNRRLAGSDGSTQELDKKYLDLRRDFIGRTLNPEQQAALAPRMDSHYLSRRENVIRHEVAQGREYLKVSAEANIKQHVLDAANIRQPETLAKEIEDLIKFQSGVMIQLQEPESTIELAADTISTQIANASVLQTLETDAERAQLLLNRVKHDIPLGAGTALQDSIDIKVFGNRMIEVGEKVMNAINATDKGLTQKEVRKMVFSKELTGGMTSKQKESVLSHVKTLVSEDAVDKRKAVLEARNRLDDLQKATYIRALRDDISVAEAFSMLANNQIDEVFHGKLIGMITKESNDPRIPAAEKSRVQMEIADAWLNLGGTEFEDGKITEAASENTAEELSAFRDLLFKRKGHLTSKMHADYLRTTERNLSEPAKAKRGIVRSLIAALSAIPTLGPVGMAAAMNEVLFDMVLESTTEEESAQIKTRTVATQQAKHNPQFAAMRTEFEAGKTVIITNASGRQAKVTGFDVRGFPTSEWIR